MLNIRRVDRCKFMSGCPSKSIATTTASANTVVNGVGFFNSMELTGVDKDLTVLSLSCGHRTRWCEPLDSASAEGFDDGVQL